MKRKHVILVAFLGFLAYSLFFQISSGHAFSYKSRKPFYAKIILTEDGSKVLSLVFDESRGTGKGYNTIYADVNFNGSFDEAEKIKGKTEKRSGNLYCSFRDINLKIPYNEKAKGVSNPCSVMLNYRKYGGGREYFYVTTNIELLEDSTRWEYSFSGAIKPTERLENAAVWGPNRTPEIRITTRSDPQKKRNTGIGLGLVAGAAGFECKKGGSPVKAHVVIKDSDGKVVHKDAAELGKFVFG